jgi:lactoylglutathione lyase
VKALYDKAVAAGAEKVEAPNDKPWGQLVSYVRDPDGNLVNICSPVAVETREENKEEKNE